MHIAYLEIDSCAKDVCEHFDARHRCGCLPSRRVDGIGEAKKDPPRYPKALGMSNLRTVGYQDGRVFTLTCAPSAAAEHTSQRAQWYRQSPLEKVTKHRRLAHHKWFPKTETIPDLRERFSNLARDGGVKIRSSRSHVHSTNKEAPPSSTCRNDM